jgi:non-specific serine/threonine protein kinase
MANLSLASAFAGDWTAATDWAYKALSVARDCGLRRVEAMATGHLAWVDLEMRRFPDAERRYRTTLRVLVDLDDLVGIADCLDGFACIASAVQASGRALELAEAAESIRSRASLSAWPQWRAGVGRWLSRAESKLGPRVAAAARARGRTLTVKEAVALALMPHGQWDDGQGRVSLGRFNGSLTKRELEITTLLVEGLTNREIAKRLTIGERTVDAHVDHVRNKLGLRTRVQIAAWAMSNLGRPGSPD